MLVAHLLHIPLTLRDRVGARFINGGRRFYKLVNPADGLPCITYRAVPVSGIRSLDYRPQILRLFRKGFRNVHLGA